MLAAREQGDFLLYTAQKIGVGFRIVAARAGQPDSYEVRLRFLPAGIGAKRNLVGGDDRDIEEITEIFIAGSGSIGQGP